MSDATDRALACRVVGEDRLALIGDADRRHFVHAIADLFDRSVDRGEDLVRGVLDPAGAREVLTELTIGSALGLEYTYPEYMLLLSLTNFVASIPVSPVGNVGPLEAACTEFFGGVPAALALALLIRAAYLLWGVPGLLYFVTHRKEMPHEPVEDTVDVIEHDVDEPPHAQPQEVPVDADVPVDRRHPP